ncbi:MAG TPA: hypothetical protein DEB73_02490 [Candidatus Magasanikbacteria bacterium]|uniref:Uncharacterized protein n=2 Tax=Candidatus Magasanikiibacteriota TaxID=1752731 RepID=A0A0G0WMS0_9BACT|nr:MAG: hypothetical protein UU49_C0010G0008 [Candidatus Magasanikbacteria bacterium GW2011_GWC2_41_17]KKS13377.1 MAG: hypothetical protein UU69_C0007G0008 [Candidatus Magasanikbacteria bacterium GW2011_GWA2_41_55]HBV58103.1 hypothetical protein [Candidatus Magasanikbacteria bacterium]HBX16330.1 hypothetical protein [Candidatus Magasanikbacteria bacterium]
MRTLVIVVLAGAIFIACTSDEGREVVADPITDKIAEQFEPVERSCETHCLGKVFYDTPAYRTCMKECIDKGGRTNQISVDACELALSALGLHVDRTVNPLGSNHDPQKDFEGILRLRKLCQESSNRIALVRHYLTDERLPFLMEAYAKAVLDCNEISKVCSKYIPLLTPPK